MLRTLPHTSLPKAIRRFHEDEGGMEALQMIVIVAVAAVMFALLNVLWKGGQGITGKSVGIAVLDSGVFFEPKIKNKFNQKLNNNFFGQVDFVGDGTCPAGGTGMRSTTVTNVREVRRLAAHGSRLLRRRLDASSDLAQLRTED